MKDISFWLTVICVAMCINTHAQKLPNVQQGSMRAPANIKIDGKPTEWGDNFSAYNPTTEVSYTVANDAENLYFVTSVAGQDMANRVLAGGLSFVINRSGKKNGKEKMVFTFPTYDTPTGKDNYKINPLPRQWTDFEIAERMFANNGMLKNNVKYIRTEGAPGVDTLLSIYNAFNVRAACYFNMRQEFSIEIAIPIKYLDNYIIQNKLSYRIVVNGGKYQPAKNMVVVFADGHQATEEDISKEMSQQHDRQARLAAQTGFSAEYTLAKW